MTFVFAGTVSFTSDFSGQLDGSIGIGTPLHGSYTFDSAAADQDPLPTAGIYLQPAPLGGITVSMGTYSFATDPSIGTLRILVREGYDRYQVSSTSENISSDPSLAVVSISWTLDDIVLLDKSHTGDAISTDDLLLVPPDLTTWAPSAADFHVGLTGPDASFDVYGGITSIAIIPEPSSFSLLATGLVSCVVLQRRRATPIARRERQLGNSVPMVLR